jgi:hypothetical protein
VCLKSYMKWRGIYYLSVTHYVAACDAGTRKIGSEASWRHECMLIFLKKRKASRARVEREVLSSMSSLGPWPIFLSVHIHTKTTASHWITIFIHSNMESEQVGLG